MAQRVLKTSRPISSLLLGLAGALAVVAGYLLDLDRRVELHTLDLRFRHTSRTPAPSDIVQVDIDDRSLTELGRWPWPRERLAGIIDVLQTCGARAVVLDVILPEPQKVRYVSVAGEVYGSGGDVLGDAYAAPVFDDSILARTIKKKNNVFLPMYLDLGEQAKGPLQERLEKLLAQSPGMSAESLSARLDLPVSQIQPVLGAARQTVIERRAAELLGAEPDAPLIAFLTEVLGGSGGHEAPVVRDAAEKAYLRQRAILALQRFAIPDHLVGDLPVRSGRMVPPLVTFAQQAAASGFVTFDPDPDGVVRRIPLLGRSGGRMYPQFAFAAAMRELARRHGGKPSLSADASAVTIRLPRGAQRRIPVDDDGFMLIHWTRPVRLGEKRPSQRFRISAAAVAKISRARRKIREAEELAYGLRVTLLSLGYPQQPDLEKEFHKLARLPEQFKDAREATAAERRRIERMRVYEPSKTPDLQELNELRRYQRALRADMNRTAEKLVNRLRAGGRLDAFLGKPEAPAPATRPATRPDRNREYQRALADFRRLKARAMDILRRLDSLPRQERQAQSHADKLADEMTALVGDRICIIGSTSTGAADFVPTPIHPRTPGVDVHANILQTILSGNFVTKAHPAVDIQMILVAGAIISLVAATRPVLHTALILLALAAGYAAFNALVVFALWKTWLVMAAPIAAMLAAMLVVTAYRTLTEERAKQHIRGMFAHAMSPALVDRLLEDPSLAELGGQKRELTCMFSDIAGFTALAEKLGPQETVRLLNRYFDRVTEVVQNRRGGYLNKFLGDGIFAFFGAPVFQDDHPMRALQAAIDCQYEVAQLNESLAGEFGRPVKLAVRVGLATGEAMVGNCGSTERLDYTAIGDCVNLSSRLEAACKFFGTRVLVDEATWRQCEHAGIRARPLGGVYVAGFNEAVNVWEILPAGKADAARGDFDKAVADFTRAIELFERRDFARAKELLSGVREILPDDKPTRIFLDLCDQGLSAPAGRDVRPRYVKPEENIRTTGGNKAEGEPD